MFWVVIGLIYGFCVVVMIALQLFIFVGLNLSPFSTQTFIIVSACTAAVPAALAARNRRRRCIWEVNFDGLTSPSIDKIKFAEVVALHIGYPQKTTIAAGSAKALAQGLSGSDDTDAHVRIIRMADGRLFPLDVDSPAIANSEDFVSKVTELLVGKIRPNSEFTDSDVKALASRPANKFVPVAA